MVTLVKNCPKCFKDFKLMSQCFIKYRKFCSKHCATSFQMSHTFGESHPRWKGGKTIHKSGYVLIRAKDHPFVNKNNYILEHRLVMEKYLGRFLEKHEDVHHINGIKHYNRIKNLILLTKSKHAQYHTTERHKTKKLFGK